MNSHFCPGALWFNKAEQSEHFILAISETDVQTLSPPGAAELEASQFNTVPVCSWHGSHLDFFQEFSPPQTAEVD